MCKKTLKIAESFVEESNLQPHMNCLIATKQLINILRQNNIAAEWVTYFVDVPHYNGEIPEHWSIEDDIEHHCIRIENQILDVTAAQFNDINGQTMPKIYFGSLPTFYNEN